MSVDMALEKLHLSGVVQLTVTLEMDTTFPHVSFASVSFVGKYELIMSISWTYSVIIHKNQIVVQSAYL